MNQEQFEYYKKTVKDFEKNHCFWVEPESFIYDKHTSQARALGHVVDKMPLYAEHIKNNVKLPPVSVADYPSTDQYQLKDGCTRVGGGEIAEKPVYATNYQDKILQWGPDEWSDFQGSANDHPQGTPNSKQDMETKIQDQINSGRIRRLLGYSYVSKKIEFIECAAKHFRYTIYPNSGRPLDWFRTKVKKALKPTVAPFYADYSFHQAFKFYAAQTGFAGTQNGDISGNRVVYTFSRTSQRNPNIIGHVATKMMDNPDLKVTLIYHVGNLVGKDDKGIKRQRVTIEKWFDKVKQHYGWLDELYFLPQIKQGNNQENMFKLIKAR